MPGLSFKPFRYMECFFYCVARIIHYEAQFSLLNADFYSSGAILSYMDHTFHFEVYIFYYVVHTIH